MPITLILLQALLAAGVAPAARAAPAPAASAPTAGGTLLTIDPIDAARLEPALARALPGLLSAALESGGIHQTIASPEGEGWEIEVKVTGRGPWHARALATRRGGGSSGARATTGKVSFKGREDLPNAVDDLAAQLDALLRRAGPASEASPVAGGRPGTVPLSRALSSAQPAVEDYLAALSALRSADAGGAASLLDRALRTDPSFGMAAAQRILIQLASGEGELIPASLAATRPRKGAEGSPLSDGVLKVLTPIALGAPDPDPEAEGGGPSGSPLALWGGRLRALALGAAGRHDEALKEWERIAKADPADLPARVFLGRALMATGDFKGAAERLGSARAAWPSNLFLYTLQAECLVRLRDTVGAREVLEAMNDHTVREGLSARNDALYPQLLLVSLDLMEGNYRAALQRSEDAVDARTPKGEPLGPNATLLELIAELKRDLVSTRDNLLRKRQLEDAQKALDRYEASLTPEERQVRLPGILRLKGQILAKGGNTVEAWKVVDQMRQAKEGAGGYDEAYLSAAVAMKEDDVEGALGHFERAVAARGMLVDYMDLGQTQLALRRFDEARRSLLRFEKGLESYAAGPAEGRPASEHSDLILADPLLAVDLPIYQYVRARLAYETGDGAESRRYFNRMLKYLRKPDEQLRNWVSEAVARGASPE